MPNNSLRRLNIFIDETGEPALKKSPSELYGVSFVLHEHSVNIGQQIATLNENFSLINYNGMVHMGDLVHGRGDYEDMDIPERRKIYTTLYRFAMKLDAKYYTVIVEKNKITNLKAFNDSLKAQIQDFVLGNLRYFYRFGKIVVYYDGGQKQLSRIIDEAFGRFPGYERRRNFNRREKRLFQVADMLTTTDRLIYKYTHKIDYSNSESTFYTDKDIKTIAKETAKHRL